MTRPDQKRSERETLHAVLAALGLHPDEEPEEGEAPDFTMPIAGRWIGVEMTMYQSGATVEDGRGRRQVESEWDRLKAAGDAFRRDRPDLADVNVGLMFRASVPPPRQHAAFLEEIAAFVRGHASKLNDKDLECWPLSFSTPLMQTYLRTLYLRKDRYQLNGRVRRPAGPDDCADRGGEISQTVSPGGRALARHSMQHAHF